MCVCCIAGTYLPGRGVEKEGERGGGEKRKREEEEEGKREGGVGRRGEREGGRGRGEMHTPNLIHRHVVV